MNRGQRKRSPLHSYARYTGIAFQMIGIILAGVWAGSRLDKHLGTDRPWYTALFTIIAVVLAVYFTIRDLIR